MRYFKVKPSVFLSLIYGCVFLFLGISSSAQITERARPKEWEFLVKGGRFMDRFLPMKGRILSTNTWGGDNVKPRLIDNGIEDNIWSYWCGSLQRADNGKYHLFVCAWLESAEKGHNEWPNSYVFDAVGDHPEGPFVLQKMIGKGHNVEAFRLKDGRYVLYVIDGRYIAEDINGPWVYSKFDFDRRDRKIIEGLSNLSFAAREDGSYLMVCRGGGIWISRDGISTYQQITDKRVYPDVHGEFEDPVIWRDHVQYHMIVNDWLGRIAYYLRSKDGISWVVDPGEAYMPGMAFHADGTVENWFKYERIKMYQDQYGRAIQANLAVIDLEKEGDFGHDNHSSKQITIPVNPGVLLSVVDQAPITNKTKIIRLRIQAEPGFDPQTDVDISSLVFGASQVVNYGKGAKALQSDIDGKDLIVTFAAHETGITADEFAPKLLGKYKDGSLLYGYTRLPGVDYQQAILSARAPVFVDGGGGAEGTIEVQNFGQVDSRKSSIQVSVKIDNRLVRVAEVPIPVLKPYEKITLPFRSRHVVQPGIEHPFVVSIEHNGKVLSTFTGNMVLKKD